MPGHPGYGSSGGSPNKPGLGWGQGGRWQKSPGRPHPLPNHRPKPQPQPQEPQGLSLNDQFQQFLQQDPSAIGIGGTQSLVDIMGDYAGGFMHGGQAYDAGNTMQQTIRNKFLNTLSQQDSLRAQNHMGYFTGGERVNAPQGGFQWTGSLPDLDPGESWDAQNQGVHYGLYSRGDDGGYSWDPIGDNAGAYGVQPGTTDALIDRRTLGPYGRTRRRGGTTGGFIY